MNNIIENILMQETPHIYQDVLDSKEIVIAIQFTEHDNSDLLELIPGYIVRHTDGVTGEPFLRVYQTYLDKAMNDNVVVINKNDWVVQRVNKEFYIFNDDDFQRKFKRAEPDISVQEENPTEKLSDVDRMRILEREMIRNRDLMQDFIRAVNKVSDVLKDTSGEIKELRNDVKDFRKAASKNGK